MFSFSLGPISGKSPRCAGASLSGYAVPEGLGRTKSVLLSGMILNLQEEISSTAEADTIQKTVDILLVHTKIVMS